MTRNKFSEYSFSKYLRSSNKSSDEFEFMLNQLTLEEIIALKFLFTKKRRITDLGELESNPYGVDFFSDQKGNTTKTWMPNRFATTTETTRPPIKKSNVPPGWMPLTPKLAKGFTGD